MANKWGCNWMAAVLVAVSLLSGCATSTPVTDAPLPVAKQQELRKTMLGTWTLTASEDTDGGRDPMKMSHVTWTFNKDGTGVYHQVVPTVGMDKTHNFKWQLEGRNIRVFDEGGDASVFRADKWSNDHMKWFNYKLTDYYLVDRQKQD